MRGELKGFVFEDSVERTPMLEEKAVKRAVLHLSRLGDTDIFPAPFEFMFYSEEVAAIAAIISKVDMADYRPKSCFEALSPKGELSFRIAHQLYPVDSLLYTSAVIEIGPALEGIRMSAGEGPFSYRFVDQADEPHLFTTSSNFHDWLLHVRTMCEQEAFADVQYVVETDISDFYARIYFHRIEHVLDDCEAPNAVRKVIEGIIKATRARQSYGLPVGTSASRLLAEGLLNDTDRMIAERTVGYSRYVDDFRMIVSHQYEVHGLLCKVAEHLMLTEGLSLNAGKTKTYNTEEAVNIINGRMSDVFNDDNFLRLSHYVRQVYEDEEVSAEDIEDIEPALLANKLCDLMKSTNSDYNAIRVVLKALRAVVFDDPLGLLKDAEQLLYYVPRDYCLVAGAFAQRAPALAGDIAEHLVEQLQRPPYSEMTLSRLWVGHLFITQAVPISRELLDRINLVQNSVEKRQRLLLLGILRDRGYFREQKTRFNEASDWEKPALMFGAACLARGEYATWLDTIKGHLPDPLAEHYQKWLKANQPNLFEKLKQQVWIKSKAERLAEEFTNLLDEETPL